MTFRLLDLQKDLTAVNRIWHEVGWVESPDTPAIKHFLSVSRGLVADIDGAPECAVLTVPGRMRCYDQDLRLCVVTAVTTSRIARRKGFAGRLTALQLAHAAKEGAQIAALGMFDQGFYDKLGFGTGGYDNRFSFDPASLRIDSSFNTPKRLGKQDWQAMHACMDKRLRGHGGVVVDGPEMLRGELALGKGGFGLGYESQGGLSHFMWLEDRGEHGPYYVQHIAYQNREQLLELLALIKALADQVAMVSMLEPPEVQFQLLLEEPFRHRRIAAKSEFQNEQRAHAWWQARVLDVPACVNAVHSHYEPVRFNLCLEDPVTRYLDEEPWPGVGGNYVVEIAAESHAEKGEQHRLPTLTASVGAFTRLLLGVTRATGMTITDGVDAPMNLLEQIEAAIPQTRVHTTWEF